MSSFYCPYLGLKDDPNTTLSFPSQGNFCHHASPVAAIKETYQQAYCLTAEHTACPIFTAAHLKPLPTDIVASDPPRSSSRRKLAFLGIPALLAGSAALIFGWNAIYSQANTIVDTGGASRDPLRWSLLNKSLSDTPSPSPTITPSARPQVASCPLPAGWSPYIVNPTDSLYRLSMIYGVSEEQLQQVNCLSANAIILPGQVIYVPNLPTDTPLPTQRPYPVQVNNVSASSNNHSHPDTAPPAAATTVPPVPAAATPVPKVPTSKPKPAVKNDPPSHQPHAKPTPKLKKNEGTGHNGGNGNGNKNGRGKGKGK